MWNAGCGGDESTDVSLEKREAELTKAVQILAERPAISEQYSDLM